MISLPRISWTIGQTLLPDHMRGLEDSLISDTIMRGVAFGLPFHGLADIVFSKSLRTDGLLSLESGTVVMRSGRLLSIGGNSTVNMLNLNTGSETRLTVFLHLLQSDESVEGARRQNLSSHDVMPTWKWRLHLSFSEDVQGTIEYLQLGVFEKDIRSEWTQSTSYIPPLLKVGSSGYLQDAVGGLLGVLEKYTSTLKEELADIQLSGENLIMVKRCLSELRIFKLYLTNALGEIQTHPFHFYDRLQRFYLEVANYRGSEPVLFGRPYQHDNLSGCLYDLIQGTLELLDSTRAATPMIEFKPMAGVFSVTMTDDSLLADKWFLLVQKHSVQTDVSLEGVKVSALPRLQIIHKYFLSGIVLKKINRPIFQHYFGPEVDIYEMDKSEELTQALNDRTIAFLSEPRFESVRFFLYWSSN